MAKYSDKVNKLLENPDRLKKADLLFALVLTGEFKTREAAEAALEEAELTRRGPGGRKDFYEFLRNGGTVRNKAELIELINRTIPDPENPEKEKPFIPFSDNEKGKSNYGHWLAIAELVEAVRGTK